LRTDFLGKADYCGLFMTPTLRNVATRSVFFHNGVFHTLREVMEFYVQRDTNPDKWYTRDKDGRVRSFDDLPVEYHDNVNVDPPFGGRPGDEPALSDDEIDDVIAFMKTLTDGYRIEK
jgi:cytochrome c peroxidase